MSAAPLNLGVIGLGFMGRTHIGALHAAAAAGAPVRLAAVADRDESRLAGRVPSVGNIATSGAGQPLLFDPASVRGYTDPAALIADPAVGAVSICTHTDTHVPLALAALAAGKHVLVEKPVALRWAEVQALADAARRAARVCMPAMCMRFWPGWTWLADRVRDGSLGPVRSATFQRLGTVPDWTAFYADTARSGGSLFDLHIHDADFIRSCFGEPAEVVSTGSIAHVTTLYRFAHPGGPAHVIAEGGQDHAPGFGFKMRYVVAFEHATADFDLAREHPLLLCRHGAAEPVALPSASGYEAEMRHFIDVITGKAAPIATIEDAVKTTRLLEAEAKSLQTRQPVQL